MTIARLRRSISDLVVLALLSTIAPLPLARAQATRLPDRLTDQEFWQFINDMSEAPGNFRSENLVSNETSFQYVIPSLLKVPREGQVYLGVAPEQNFTYIAAIKPKMAIIIDIRKGNKLEHLMYKALFELSTDRADFASRLFSKARPAHLDSTVTLDSIVGAFWNVPTDSVLYRKNKEAVKQQLTKTHGFAISDEDWADLVWIYDQFYFYGWTVNYNSGTGTQANMPGFADIVLSRDQTGLNRGFMATEATWRWLKDMETRNMIVPVVGNFAGPKAIRAVGAWLKQRNATVTAIYASNVEQYLWQDGIAYNYYDNVAALPIDANSVFLRSNGVRGVGGGAIGMSAPNVLCSVQQLLDENKAGRINGYPSIFNYCQ